MFQEMVARKNGASIKHFIPKCRLCSAKEKKNLTKNLANIQ